MNLLSSSIFRSNRGRGSNSRGNQNNSWKDLRLSHHDRLEVRSVAWEADKCLPLFACYELWNKRSTHVNVWVFIHLSLVQSKLFIGLRPRIISNFLLHLVRKTTKEAMAGPQPLTFSESSLSPVQIVSNGFLPLRSLINYKLDTQLSDLFGHWAWAKNKFVLASSGWISFM